MSAHDVFFVQSPGGMWMFAQYFETLARLPLSGRRP